MSWMSFVFKAIKLYFLLWCGYVWFAGAIRGENARQVRGPGYFSGSSSVNLVIAHPDDEVMFFSPTLMQLDNWLPNDVAINVICFSKGVNVDGSIAGESRARELKKSVSMLIEHDRPVTVHQLDYKDGKDQIWDLDSMVWDLKTLINPSKDYKRKDLLITFDEHGVSDHPNHIACHNAVHRLIEEEPLFMAYQLESHSTNVILKYSFFAREIVKYFYNYCHQRIKGQTSLNKNMDVPYEYVLFNTHSEYIMAYATMLNAHESQVVWFRYGWWFFSRLTYANELKLFKGQIIN
ncbi:hypothetical protein Kpol_1068p4 [Vanderwaltozyma polyspora DSM 70294]|uniref:N-acetylglucosaminylphosphatidylinositol deacetylase n=1 Tax=Vanderwaltozyma polyspora (strain ATCC 22028 / DSM 70294 / BCRC 21397 / CBS 2163 / NBRC 10782 / NRRL Y-8283 / UCD 57-17) TaxID=436907 RepID=A7TSQ9_VANPO|nr:uncharacterized protein Kpol_1068p4 [Vanderwaltozyma polyspora DSM 70294]EDO14694.1 hypothetical protein Kpol_1068p4 [Vanderwaltozyma polyspora DSM 70294]